MLTVHMIGNAHLDPVWLWRWQLGADEALATFRSAADRCDEYQEFLYTRGEAWLYRLVERLDPELFARIRCLLDRGQWHITGGQVIQPDANLPKAIGWQRQFLYGQHSFLERFGIRPTIAYDVDTSGHPATLPDILEAAGCVGYVFHRPTPLQVALHANVFRWCGPGGGEVMGMRLVPAYVIFGTDLSEQILGAAQAVTPGLEHVMCFYGVGNHGGGPTKAHIEYIRKIPFKPGGIHAKLDGLEHPAIVGSGIDPIWQTPSPESQDRYVSLHCSPVPGQAQACVLSS